MSSGSIEQTAGRLSDLHHQVVDDVALAVLAFGFSLAATQQRPEFAFPLFAGGLTALAFAVRSSWLRWDLLDRLLVDRDAYAIPEVRGRGERLATMKNRRSLAASIRWILQEPGYGSSERIQSAAEDLEALANELEDEELTLVPVCAVVCERLLTDGSTSALLNTGLPGEDARVRVRQIRAGFEPRSGDQVRRNAIQGR